MTTYLAYFIARSIPVLVGAAEIEFAIQSFKKGKYFSFGFWIMSACSNLLVIAGIINEGMKG